MAIWAFSAPALAAQVTCKGELKEWNTRHLLRFEIASNEELRNLSYTLLTSRETTQVLSEKSLRADKNYNPRLLKGMNRFMGAQFGETVALLLPKNVIEKEGKPFSALLYLSNTHAGAAPSRVNLDCR